MFQIAVVTVKIAIFLLWDAEMLCRRTTCRSSQKDYMYC